MSALLTACQRDDSPPAAVSAPAAPAKASVAVNPLDLMETDGLLQRIGTLAKPLAGGRRWEKERWGPLPSAQELAERLKSTRQRAQRQKRQFHGGGLDRGPEANESVSAGNGEGIGERARV